MKVNNTKMLVSNLEVESIARRIDLQMFHKKRVLITGGTGMIGSYLVEALCFVCELQGIIPKEIHLVTRNHNYSKISNLSSYKFVTISNSQSSSENSYRGFEYLIHAASPASPLSYPSLSDLIEVNVGMLSQMITEETERVLYISSGEIYGSDAPTPVSEEFVGKIDHELPRSAYPLAKIAAEKIGQEICVKYGIDFRIVRLFHSFGPGVRENDGRSFADFLWQCARGKDPILFSKGHDVRSFLYSEDAVAGMLTVFLKDQSTGPINVGSEQAVTILEFAKKVSELSGQKERVTFRLEEQGYATSPNHVIIPDTSKLKALGWNQKVTLEESIRRTLGWVKNQIA
jgi:UDP-glucuronate decarboxylase